MYNDNIQLNDYSVWTYEDLVEHITVLNFDRITEIKAAIERHHPVWYPTVVDDLEVIDRQHGTVKAHLYEYIRNHAESQEAYDPPVNQRRAVPWPSDGINFNPFDAIEHENLNHIFKVAQISTRLITTRNLYFLDLIESLDLDNEIKQDTLYGHARELTRQARAARLHAEWD